MSTLYSTTMTSPIRPLTIVANDHAIVAITWDDDVVDPKLGDATNIDDTDGTEATSGAETARVVLEQAVAQLEEYFAGARTAFDLPLEPVGTEFQQRAWEALQQIPYGETISYGEQAALLGDKNKSRAVGAANGKNPIPIVVPCHRVVGSNGHLTGFAGGLDTKAWLLDHEFQVRAGG